MQQEELKVRNLMQEFKHELLRICMQVVAQDEKGMKYIRRYYKINQIP